MDRGYTMKPNSRGYGVTQTPFQRLCASAAATVHPDRAAALRRLCDTLDPFELSGRIQVNLERLYQLSAEATRNASRSPQFPQVFSESRRSKKKERKTTAAGFILCGLRTEAAQ